MAARPRQWSGKRWLADERYAQSVGEITACKIEKQLARPSPTAGANACAFDEWPRCHDEVESAKAGLGLGVGADHCETRTKEEQTSVHDTLQVGDEAAQQLSQPSQGRR